MAFNDLVSWVRLLLLIDVEEFSLGFLVSVLEYKAVLVFC